MHTKVLSHKQRFAIGFLAGLGAGIIASAVMVLLSITINGVSLPDILSSTITQLMPLTTFQQFHQVFGANAKLYLLIVILVGQCLVFAFSGGICSLISSTAHMPPVQQTADELDAAQEERRSAEAQSRSRRAAWNCKAHSPSPARRRRQDSAQ